MNDGTSGEDTLQHTLNEDGSSKLTDWAKEPSILQLKQDLEAARPSHQLMMTKIAAWRDLMYVTGKEKPKPRKNRSQVQPKLVRRQAEWRYSALTEPFLGSPQLFKIAPTTFEDAEGARQNELVINHQFRTKLKRIKFIDEYVRSTVDEGTCFVRTGWCRKTKMVKETVPVFSYYAPETQEEIDALEQAVLLKEQDPRSFDEQADPAIKAAVEYFEETDQAAVAVATGEEEVEVEKVLVNQPDLKIFNPDNVIIDPSCEGDLDKAMFAILTFETSRAELVKEGRYKNLNKVIWDDNSPINDQDNHTQTPSDFQFRDKSRKKVVAHEYWGYLDIDGNDELTPIVATWIGNTLIRLEKNPYPDQKIPLVVVPYLPVKRELHGEPDAELLGDNQRILGAVTRGMIDLLGRSANSQQGFAKGMLDALNRRKFESGEDYEFNPNVNPQQGHIMHKYPELPQSAMAMLGLQNHEAEALTGVKSFSGGMSGESYGDVAAGIRGVLDAASKREMAILRRLAFGLVEIARKIVAMNGEFLSEEETVRVTNSEFVTVRREDLKGEYDYEVDISTAEIDANKAQDLTMLLQTLGNTVDIGITKKVLAEICRLKKMPELREDILNFQPEPDPLLQKQKELEIAKLEAEISEITMRARLAQAKAERELAETDAIDADVVNDQTGVKHARDLERQQGQAEGNKELEVTKALLKSRKPDESNPDIEAALGFNQLTSAQRQGDMGMGV